jgi:hypothetical protein
MNDDSVIGAPRRPTGSLVIPAYDEAATISTSMQRAAEVLTTALADRGWEIVVVDDGSRDETFARATSAVAEVESFGVDVRILRHPVNRGLGAALGTGIAATRGDVVVIIDCDLSYHPGHIPQLVRALELNHAQLAVASPYMAGGHAVGVPPHIERRSRMANRFLAWTSNSRLKTLTGMVRAYDGPFVRSLALRSTDEVINIEAIYKTEILHGRVVEVPATLDWTGLARRADRTGMRTKRMRARTYETMLSGLLFRPYLVFAVGGLSLVAVGVLLALATLLAPGSQFGWTFLGVSLIGTGMSSCLVSILSVQVKRSFEELYYLHSTAQYHMTDAAVDPPAHPEDENVQTTELVEPASDRIYERREHSVLPDQRNIHAPALPDPIPARTQPGAGSH